MWYVTYSGNSKLSEENWAKSLSFATWMMIVLKLISNGNIVHTELTAASYVYSYTFIVEMWLAICIIVF